MKLKKNLLLVLIILTFTLINLGGHVHNTGSSLACPDWPLCYNQIMPEMKGGVLIEHSHRLLATLVGLLTILSVFMTKKGSQEKTVAYLALGLVVVQGILGGLTVIFKLPPLISTAHLGLSMIFFCTLIYFHDLQENSKKGQVNPHLKMAFTTSLVLLYVQIILGAFIRHRGLGTICGLGYDHAFVCSGNLIPESLGQGIHLLHRFLGLLVGTFIISVNINYMKMNKKDLILPGFSVLIIVLQVWLGVMTVGTALRPFITMLHLGGATLSLALLWKINLKVKSPGERE